MPRKTNDLVYGVDDRPPAGTLLLLGLQHIMVNSAGWVILVAVVAGFGGTVDQTEALIRMSMIAVGIGTMLQGINRGPVGSGYLCPAISGPAYVSASMLAGRTAGFPALFGMTALAGLSEVIFARLLPRLRFMFPPEVVGLVVTMVGFEMIPLAAPRFLGVEITGGAHSVPGLWVAVLTLASMCLCSIWGKGPLRLYPALVGVGIGWIASFLFGTISSAQIQQIADAPWLALPRRVVPGLAFKWELLVPFLVASLSSGLKGVGDLTLCQKINDADWLRPDMKSISRGMTAAGLCTLLSGLLGTVGHSTSSSNVGLSLASGATSRQINFYFGGMVISLAFLPKVAAIFSVLPRPVMGALLVYAACYMILAGLQVLTSRMMDSRRILVVGIAFVFGLSVDIVPGLYHDVPHALLPLLGSSLSFATVLVLALNLLARIGVARKVVLDLDAASGSAEKIFSVLEAQGSAWGARKDVIYSASVALTECFESISQLGLAQGSVQAALSFDELTLKIDVSYEGELFEIPDSRPNPHELLTSEQSLRRLSGYLVSQHVDRVRSEQKDGRCHLLLQFAH